MNLILKGICKQKASIVTQYHHEDYTLQMAVEQKIPQSSQRQASAITGLKILYVSLTFLLKSLLMNVRGAQIAYFWPETTPQSESVGLLCNFSKAYHELPSNSGIWYSWSWVYLAPWKQSLYVWSKLLLQIIYKFGTQTFARKRPGMRTPQTFFDNIQKLKNLHSISPNSSLRFTIVELVWHIVASGMTRDYISTRAADLGRIENEKERKGKERKGKERKGKERKGKERKGKERKGKERTEGWLTGLQSVQIPCHCIHYRAVRQLPHPRSPL